MAVLVVIDKATHETLLVFIQYVLYRMLKGNELKAAGIWCAAIGSLSLCQQFIHNRKS